MTAGDRTRRRLLARIGRRHQWWADERDAAGARLAELDAGGEREPTP